tara:strand:+ start:515 stop:1342 length:828 start_codon:yes stop_codon:yes gene_type:complete
LNVFEYAETILLKGDLDNKLIDKEIIDWSVKSPRSPIVVDLPVRNDSIRISSDQVKFPKKGALKDSYQRGKALHFFANHELLAIEMMAYAIVMFPFEKESVYKSLVETISEEQKHLKLYIKRMNEFGVEFGDFPLNQYFWSFMEKMENIEMFFSVIALTFEQANLDFALYYKNLFKDLGDSKTAAVMEVIYQDEIKHVARGRSHLSKVVSKSEEYISFWDYFLSLLPAPLTADRAKGMIFDEKGRQKAGLDQAFIQNLKDYKGDFKITQRKEWKS